VNIEEIACQIVDSALKVHRALGPGLLESAYQACLAHDLRRRGRHVECEVPMPLEFDGTQIDVGYRLDMRIDSVIIVENKTVEKLLPVHQAQVLTYLKLSGSSLGFLINWNVPVLREGLKRIVLNHPSRPIKANREDAKDGKK
jgi:GxxExxY protein